jgi:uncharacterized membrane protein YjgN (DUF898 family)
LACHTVDDEKERLILAKTFGSAIPSVPQIMTDPTCAEIVHAEMVTPHQTSVQTTGDNLSTLVWRGNFLTILTLGIYRFWYKTGLRQWYWRNTLVGGDGFEYRGTAKEKFLGFLYALAVVVPIYFLGTLIGLFAGEMLGNIVSGISLAVIGLLIQYGAFRSRRYRLTRTVWRGVRFDQTGSAWAYAIKSAGWIVVTLLTLGLTFPAMRRALEEYRITNTRFGTAEGQFTAKTGPLMKRWLLVWIGPLLFGIIAIGMIGASMPNPSGLGILMAFLAPLWPFLLWPWYRANEFRYFTGNILIGQVSFQSAFDTRAYYKQYLKFAFLMFVSLIGLIGLAGGLIFSMGGINPNNLHFGVIAVSVVSYLTIFLIGSSLKELTLNQGFWRLAAGRMTVHGLDAIDDVLGTGVKDEAATGEGLADALDFGGI